jgi:hypothetical protein
VVEALRQEAEPAVDLAELGSPVPSAAASASALTTSKRFFARRKSNSSARGRDVVLLRGPLGGVAVLVGGVAVRSRAIGGESGKRISARSLCTDALWARRPWLAFVSLVVLAILGLSPVGNALHGFPPWDATHGALDGIVVLGGAINGLAPATRWY